jgi:hypothetical protein
MEYRENRMIQSKMNKRCKIADWDRLDAAFGSKPEIGRLPVHPESPEYIGFFPAPRLPSWKENLGNWKRAHDRFCGKKHAKLFSLCNYG